MNNQSKTVRSTVWMTLTALFMAMTVALCSFSIPVPGGHLYICDVAICTAAILMDPFAAFCVGGIGAFLGDLLFYPTPMFVSLVTHGIQAVAISLISRRLLKNHPAVASGIGVSVGIIILVIGYTIGRAFIYSTPEYAIAKLPFEFLQGLIGAVTAMILCYGCGLKKLYQKMFH